MQTEIKIIVTHDGAFHADEVTALALLHSFDLIDIETVSIKRSREEERINSADLVLDVGLQFDPKKMRFDHHQFINGSVSSAGLIWQWLQSELSFPYPKIDAFIKAIDAHDCGIQRMAEFSFSDVISAYNHEDLYSPQQEVAFLEALHVAVKFIQNLKTEQEIQFKTKEIISSLRPTLFGQSGDVQLLVFPCFCKGWQAFVHGQSEYKGITHVTWYVEQKAQWVIQVPAINENTFSLNFTPLQADKKALFVHQNGFLAVYKQFQDIVDMLKRVADSH